LTDVLVIVGKLSKKGRKQYATRSSKEKPGPVGNWPDVVAGGTGIEPATCGFGVHLLDFEHVIMAYNPL
jgi:hypothetical protein